MTAATVSDVAVDPDLARRLATAGRKAEEWKERRDELIREAASNGGTLREIASLVGLSNPGVLRVIRRGADLEVHHPPPTGDPGHRCEQRRAEQAAARTRLRQAGQ